MDLYPYMGFWIYMVVPIFNFFRIFILFFIMSIKLIYPTIHVCVGHLHVFFGKMSNQFPFPFLNWIVYYFLNQLWFLYISDINPLSDIIILILIAVSNLFHFFFSKTHFTIYFSMIFILFLETHIHTLVWVEKCLMPSLGEVLLAVPWAVWRHSGWLSKHLWVAYPYLGWLRDLSLW